MPVGVRVSQGQAGVAIVAAYSHTGRVVDDVITRYLSR
jgi:hypothetical protein